MPSKHFKHIWFHWLNSPFCRPVFYYSGGRHWNLHSEYEERFVLKKWSSCINLQLPSFESELCPIMKWWNRCHSNSNKLTNANTYLQYIEQIAYIGYCIAFRFIFHLILQVLLLYDFDDSDSFFGKCKKSFLLTSSCWTRVISNSGWTHIINAHLQVNTAMFLCFLHLVTVCPIFCKKSKSNQTNQNMVHI